MHSYIVRIYRDGKRVNNGVVGTVESTLSQEQWTFRDRDELWAIVQWQTKGERGRSGKAETEC